MVADVFARQLRPSGKGESAVYKTKRGKGTEWMVLVDGQGVPLGGRLEGGSPMKLLKSPGGFSSHFACRFWSHEAALTVIVTSRPRRLRAREWLVPSNGPSQYLPQPVARRRHGHKRGSCAWSLHAHREKSAPLAQSRRGVPGRLAAAADSLACRVCWREVTSFSRRPMSQHLPQPADAHVQEVRLRQLLL